MPKTCHLVRHFRVLCTLTRYCKALWLCAQPVLGSPRLPRFTLSSSQVPGEIAATSEERQASLKQRRSHGTMHGIEWRGSWNEPFASWPSVVFLLLRRSSTPAMPQGCPVDKFSVQRGIVIVWQWVKMNKARILAQLSSSAINYCT